MGPLMAFSNSQSLSVGSSMQKNQCMKGAFIRSINQSINHSINQQQH
jgi:hypothetical protein